MPDPTPRRFTRAHARIALWLLALFTVLTAWLTSATLSIDGGESFDGYLLRIGLTVVATPLGPFTGPIARECQTCCLQNALDLLGPAAALLALGVLPQLLPPPAGRAWRVVRLVLWGLGTFAWLGSGIVSLLHALE